jgi:DNA-directed RNA polymerase subunit RPC12/RpoP
VLYVVALVLFHRSFPMPQRVKMYLQYPSVSELLGDFFARAGGFNIFFQLGSAEIEQDNGIPTYWRECAYRVLDPWRKLEFRLGYNLTEQELTELRMSFMIVGENFIQIDLAVTYICRKCGKSHSKLDYDESRFCKTCGSFLLPRFSADRGSVTLSEKTLRYQLTSSAHLPVKSDRARDKLKWLFCGKVIAEPNRKN